MKYRDLINFEPITQVVKFSRLDEKDYRENLVKTFVFSNTIKDHLIPTMVKNLDYNLGSEMFGLQVVGNYGTGKSHLMSLVSFIAENESYLDLIEDTEIRKTLNPIAGKFKVLRFELQNDEELWEVVTYNLENYLRSIGVEFSFKGHGPIGKGNLIMKMMAEFEDRYPDQGLLVVIDEMLAYLKSRSTPDKLNQDLVTLQALGQSCDGTKFKFVFGVQEMIYQSPEFQFAAEMLQKVNDRYKDITITKEDVAFIVKNRLLKKNEHQKQKVRDHLDPFLKFFNDMHGRTQEYVELFPVHPSYFENFEKIRIGKSQREILKTISAQFERILDDDILPDNPSLLTYDQYWVDVRGNSDLLADPDVRRVKEVTDTVYDKIDTHFIGAREKNKPVATRIANACAIKILQQELNKQNGTSTELLVDDLCLTNKLATDREFLIDIIDSTAKNLITATSGQYFDVNDENGEYHLRIEGGINFDQKIKDYVDTMSDQMKDEYFFKFLELNLPLDYDTYRTGFKIWQHSIEWKSHKTYRDGYIFFGNPNEKSTTHPHQHFYMYFMPIFGTSNRNHEEDEVYFIMNNLSQEFKDAVALFGAAQALEARADSSQKAIYRDKIKDLNKKARSLFDTEYTQVTMVDYMGKETPLNGYQLLPAGSTKEQNFSHVTSLVLDEWFSDERPDYPKFSQLNAPIAKENYDKMIKQALLKIITPAQKNQDGEGVLSGLGLWVPANLDYSHSPYANSILKMLKDKGDGNVLNKDEILEFVDRSDDIWLSKDFGIEAELEFVVLAALAGMGEIEISLGSGVTINATNLQELRNISSEDYFSFTHVKPPRELNFPALKAMFMGLLGRDLSRSLKDPSTFTHLHTRATEWAKKAVTLRNDIQGGLNAMGIDIISKHDAQDYDGRFLAFSRFCDKMASYTTEAKMKNFPFSVEEVESLMENTKLIEKVSNQVTETKDFKEDITYLQQCKHYVSDQAFKDEIREAIEELASILGSGNEKEKTAYKAKITSLKNRYADWYLKCYLDHRISDADDTQKHALLDSDEKAICDILKEADFLSSGHYQQIISKLNALQPANPNVNKDLILTAPFQDFNPLEYVGKPKVGVKDLKDEIAKLLGIWVQTLKDILEDPMVKSKMSLLDKSEQKLLNDFESGIVSIERGNALKIRNAIMSLHKGLEKVELTIESLKSQFNKPLTPDEAVEAFKLYVDEVTGGKDRSSIRIILK